MCMYIHTEMKHTCVYTWNKSSGQGCQNFSFRTVCEQLLFLTGSQILFFRMLLIYSENNTLEHFMSSSSCISFCDETLLILPFHFWLVHLLNLHLISD